MHTACIQTLSLKTSRQDFWSFVMSQQKLRSSLLDLLLLELQRDAWERRCFWFLKPQICLLMEINTSDKTLEKWNMNRCIFHAVVLNWWPDKNYTEKLKTWAYMWNDESEIQESVPHLYISSRHIVSPLEPLEPAEPVHRQMEWTTTLRGEEQQWWRSDQKESRMEDEVWWWRVSLKTTTNNN